MTFAEEAAAVINAATVEIERLYAENAELLAALKRSTCSEVSDGVLCGACRAGGPFGCLRYAAIANAEGRSWK